MVPSARRCIRHKAILSCNDRQSGPPWYVTICLWWSIGGVRKTFFGSFPAINQIIIQFGAVMTSENFGCWKIIIGRGQIFGGQLLGMRGNGNISDRWEIPTLLVTVHKCTVWIVYTATHLLLELTVWYLSGKSRLTAASTPLPHGKKNLLHTAVSRGITFLSDTYLKTAVSRPPPHCCLTVYKTTASQPPANGCLAG